MTSITQLSRSGIHRLILGFTVIYILAFSAAYLSDPLALAPQLDARENLDLAKAFNEGSLPDEPFYRAVLYPYLLSFLHPQALRPTLALLLGLITHFLNGFLVYRLSLKIRPSSTAARVACILYLVNPASLFYSLQILDVTLGTSLFLAGLLLGWSRAKGILPSIAGGLLLGLSVAVRPHFLPVVLIAPLALFLLVERPRLRTALIWIPIFGVLLGQGALNFRHSGEFRILPWQGSYNMWAANKPGANGLYFKQSVDVSGRANNENPTKVESIALYGQAHPDEAPPYSINAMTGYWREKTIHNVIDNPLQLLHLWIFKGYAVLNSFEQYNNLTFSFHKERLPLLKYNPVNWGILFVFGILGLAQLFRERPGTAIAIILVSLAYASTLTLFYASARFRLPLVPLMAILAGGSIGWFQNLNRERGRMAATIAIIGLSGALTYSSFADIRNTDTYIQDQLLIANANADLGRDLAAVEAARDVLREFPDRKEAQRIYAMSYFNLRLSGNRDYESFGNWTEQRNWVHPEATSDPAYATVLAYYKWHWDDRESALRIWQQVRKADPDNASLASLTLSALNTSPTLLTPNQSTILRLLNEN